MFYIREYISVRCCWEAIEKYSKDLWNIVEMVFLEKEWWSNGQDGGAVNSNNGGVHIGQDGGAVDSNNGGVLGRMVEQ